MILLRLALCCWLVVFTAGCSASETNALTPTSPTAIADASPSADDDPVPIGTRQVLHAAISRYAAL